MNRFLEVPYDMGCCTDNTSGSSCQEAEFGGRESFPKRFTTENVSLGIALVSVPGSEFCTIRQWYTTHTAWLKTVLGNKGIKKITTGSLPLHKTLGKEFLHPHPSPRLLLIAPNDLDSFRLEIVGNRTGLRSR